jgi:ABC-type sugar transport system substrate-binding protein
MEPEDVIKDGRISIDVGKDVSRRDVMKQVGAVSAAVGMTGLAGCQGDGDDNDNNDDNGGGAAQDFEFSRHPAVAPPTWEASKTTEGDGKNERQAVFVIQNIDNEFFIPMTVGFNDGLSVFDWNGEVTGLSESNANDPGEQASLIGQVLQNLEAGDVLVTTVLNNQTYNDAIQDALDQDIVVVNGHTTPNNADWNYDYMTDDVGFTYRDQEMVIPHVGIRDARAGVAQAAEAYERMIANKPEADELTVLITNEVPENPSVTRRVNKNAAAEGTGQRFFEAQEDPSVNIYGDEIINPPRDVGQAQDDIVNTLGGDSIDGVICSAFWGAAGAGQAVEAGDLEEPIVICGFDLAGTIPEIQQGRVDFTVGQDPYGQGFMNVPMAWMYIERGTEMKDLEWGVSIWDETNIEFANERRSWGDLLEWQETNLDNLN